MNSRWRWVGAVALVGAFLLAWLPTKLTFFGSWWPVVYGATMIISPQDLAQALTIQASMRGLTEAAVLDSKGNTLARTGLVFALGVDDISEASLRRADQGEVVIMTDDREERVRALFLLPEFCSPRGMMDHPGEEHRADDSRRPLCRECARSAVRCFVWARPGVGRVVTRRSR